MLLKKFAECGDRDLQRLVLGEAIVAGGDQGKSDGLAVILHRKRSIIFIKWKKPGSAGLFPSLSPPRSGGGLLA